MVIDPISNLIIKIKNASFAGKDSISVPFSAFTERVLTVLEKAGFIDSFSKKGKKVAKTIEIVLSYADGSPKVSGVERVSKLSRRIYRKADQLKPVRNGFGILVVSTPSGIMSGDEARQKGVGGEVLFKMW